MDSMTNMMSVMSQFMGTIMYHFSSPTTTYPGTSVPMNIPFYQPLI